MQFQTRVMFFGRAKTNYIIAKHGTVHKIIAFNIIHNHFFVVLILDREWPLSSGCEMTCFCYNVHNWDNNIIYSVRKQNFESSWLWDVNRGNSYTLLANYFDHTS